MTQLEEISTTIAKQTQQIKDDGKIIDEQIQELVRCQDAYLAAKTTLQQMRAKYRGLISERDENLSMLKNLSRIALGEFVPLHGDPDES